MLTALPPPVRRRQPAAAPADLGRHRLPHALLRRIYGAGAGAAAAVRQADRLRSEPHRHRRRQGDHRAGRAERGDGHLSAAAAAAGRVALAHAAEAQAGPLRRLLHWLDVSDIGFLAAQLTTISHSFLYVPRSPHSTQLAFRGQHFFVLSALFCSRARLGKL